MNIKILGLDIHPSSPSWTYDGESFTSLNIEQLPAFLKELKEDKSCLICCDAPLSGPGDHPMNPAYKNAPNSTVW